jgi:hypothetical protein
MQPYAVLFSQKSSKVLFAGRPERCALALSKLQRLMVCVPPVSIVDRKNTQKWSRCISWPSSSTNPHCACFPVGHRMPNITSITRVTELFWLPHRHPTIVRAAALPVGSEQERGGLCLLPRPSTMAAPRCQEPHV